jgi:hypothetical protein
VADSYDPTDPKWDSDEALENLKMERQVNPDLDNERLTKKLFDEASPLAAQTIINLALHGTNENTRLNAARYITDKVYDGDGGPTRSLRCRAARQHGLGLGRLRAVHDLGGRS